jgi:hypothetical protein
MDESTQWVLSLSALGLWALAVWAVYFFFLKKHMRELDELPDEERAKLLETRRQRDTRLSRKGL